MRELLFDWVITFSSFETKFWGPHRNPWGYSITHSLSSFVSVSTEQPVMTGLVACSNACRPRQTAATVLGCNQCLLAINTTQTVEGQKKKALLVNLKKKARRWNEHNLRAVMGLNGWFSCRWGKGEGDWGHTASRLKRNDEDWRQKQPLAAAASKWKMMWRWKEEIYWFKHMICWKIDDKGKKTPSFFSIKVYRSHN